MPTARERILRSLKKREVREFQRQDILKFASSSTIGRTLKALEAEGVISRTGHGRYRLTGMPSTNTPPKTRGGSLRLSDMMSLQRRLERDGIWFFSSQSAAILLDRHHCNRFRKQLDKFVDEGLIEHYENDFYGFTIRSMRPGNAQEMLATSLRDGELNYVSFESALNMYGVISQIPTILVVATTGKDGIVSTDSINIEFIHIEHGARYIFDNTILDEATGIRIAKPATALDDLTNINRNLHMVDHEEFEEVCHEFAN